jgi:FixJ family two-component response regulator
VLKPAVVVVDSDAPRRNSLVRLLYSTDWHAEPYENLEELAACWPSAGIVVAHDDGEAPEEIFEAMLDRGASQSVVLYTANPEPSRIVDTVLMGAVDYLEWPITGALLDRRLRLLSLRQASFAQLRQKINYSKRLVATLSPREREVLQALATGASNKTIAGELEISPRTIEIHRANMMTKLRVRHVGEAIAIALYAEMPNARSEDEGTNAPSFNR